MKFCTSRPVLATAAVVLFAASAPGCARGLPETYYGMSWNSSLNGTSGLRAMLAERGYTIRTAVRLTDELSGWAQGIVRFAPYPGPPEKEEAQWYRSWLAGDRDRWIIYVVRDFDTAAEYWQQIRDSIPEEKEPDRRAQAEENRTREADWYTRLPSKAKEAADARAWFATDTAITPPKVCKTLGGPWAEGVDAAAAAIAVHEPLKPVPRCVLLEGDGKALVLDKSLGGQPRMLVIASGAFLLNEALVNPARRLLADRVAAWPDSYGDNVAFVEGGFVLADEEPDSLWDMLWRIESLRWAAAQIGLAGLIAALARAPRLGRPRPVPPSGADRPAAHAVALGALLAKTGAGTDARALLNRYRQWRGGHAREHGRPSGRAQPARTRPAQAAAGQDAAAALAQPASEVLVIPAVIPPDRAATEKRQHPNG